MCCSVWLSNKSAKRYTLHSCRWYASAFALRQRMLNFVQNFLYYMMFEVIEPNWHLLEANLDSVSAISTAVTVYDLPKGKGFLGIQSNNICCEIMWFCCRSATNQADDSTV